MKYIKRTLFLLVMGLGLMAPVQAEEVHMVMCGGEIREADKVVIAAFEASHAGVTVNAEAVPWGTCQDKTMTLAAAGDPVGLAYIGSRTLKQLGRSGLILPVNISEEKQALYQPGILATVTDGGQFWGFPHAFSTKALFINCGLVEAAGEACVAPRTWTGLYNMAKAVNDNTSAAGIGITGKDFDNTMHQFLNYLYSNGGSVSDAATGEITFNSPETIETLEFYGKLAGVAQEGPMGYERSQLTQLYNDGQIGMYINGPWGAGQHNANIAEIVVPIPAGPSGESGTLLITDSIAVFKGSANEGLAMELADALTSGEAQYDLDSSWGLTPIMQYEKMRDDVYYSTDYWQVFVDSIGRGGPEPMFEDFKALQMGINSAIQGMILGEGSAADLVAEAAETLAEGL
ncbi:MAG: sugar ABC transporter substrate-binding protein [Candidatus Thioglobus autotrophicus]|jgi:multiple sugar transport system substrate-binding protein|nr:sugar ABC transporter substrate-binding protein [Candidatus Thioglobus autotrophicus]